MKINTLSTDLLNTVFVTPISIFIRLYFEFWQINYGKNQKGISNYQKDIYKKKVQKRTPLDVFLVVATLALEQVYFRNKIFDRAFI